MVRPRSARVCARSMHAGHACGPCMRAMSAAEIAMGDSRRGASTSHVERGRCTWQRRRANRYRQRRAHGVRRWVGAPGLRPTNARSGGAVRRRSHAPCGDLFRCAFHPSLRVGELLHVGLMSLQHDSMTTVRTDRHQPAIASRHPRWPCSRASHACRSWWIANLCGDRVLR